MSEDAILDEDVDCSKSKEERGVEGGGLLVAAGDEVLVVFGREVLGVRHFDRAEGEPRRKF